MAKKSSEKNSKPYEALRLNQRVLARESELHGKGCFARVTIDKGAYIGTYQGPTAKRNGRYVLWILSDEGGEDAEVGIRGLNTLRYLNHSAKPNAEFDGPDLYALKNIEVDDEIVFNYDPEGHGELGF